MNKIIPLLIKKTLLNLSIVCSSLNINCLGVNSLQSTFPLIIVCRNVSHDHWRIYTSVDQFIDPH